MAANNKKVFLYYIKPSVSMEMYTSAERRVCETNLTVPLLCITDPAVCPNSCGKTLIPTIIKTFDKLEFYELLSDALYKYN